MLFDGSLCKGQSISLAGEVVKYPHRCGLQCCERGVKHTQRMVDDVLLYSKTSVVYAPGSGNIHVLLLH